MRAIWSGAVSFGLVNIPVKLYKASEERSLKFEYLHKPDMSTVRYAKVCRQEEREIPFDEIVRGYEYAKGTFVVLDNEDFERANATRTSSIEILNFVPEEEIDSIYFEKPYYLEPDRGADKAYAILREALARSEKVGISKFVLRNREHLVIVKPESDVIVLDQLRFGNEIRDANQLNLPAAAQVTEEEVEMALALIDRLAKKFDSAQYTDTFTEQLLRVIEEKAKGKVVPIRGKAPEPTEVKDIMVTLKASLEQAERKAG